MVMIDLIHSLANQVIRERFARWSPLSDNANTHALMTAYGYDTIDVLRMLGNAEVNIRAPQTSYLDCVLLGLNPARLQDLGILLENPYKTNNDYGLSDPLQMASFFAVFGMKEDAELLLHDRMRIIRIYSQWRSSGNPRSSEFGDHISPRAMYRTWVPPDFEELGLPRVSMHEHLDSFYMEGAFEAQGYMARLKSGITPQNIEAFAMISGLKNRKLHDAMRSAAYEQARRLSTSDKGGGFRYADMTTYIRLCRPTDAMTLFGDLKGARQVLTLVRDDTKEEHYVTGLRQLAQAAPDTRKEILERMGRGPTIEEVRKVRSIGIINILDEMDWSLLQPISQEKGLRAAALPFAEKLGPTVLRRFLTEHNGRVKRLPNIETEAALVGSSLRVTDNSSVADWEIVMRRLYEMWTVSNTVRRALRTATENPAVSFLALLDAYKVSSPDIQKTLRAHPNWRGIQRALEGYEPPNPKSLWS